jgi:hypothetical protein
MNILITAHKSLLSIPAVSCFNSRPQLHPMLTLAMLNRVEVELYTLDGQETYRVVEKDDIFFIYKLQHGFLGNSYFKKLAQARNRDGALKIIHILCSSEILRWEVSPVDYFERG